MFEQVTEFIGTALGKVFGSQNERTLKRLWEIGNGQVTPLASRYEQMPETELRATSERLRARLANWQKKASP